MNQNLNDKIANAHSIGFNGGELYEWERFVILAGLLDGIKSALRPKVVSREWVENQGLAIYRAEDQHDAKVLMGHALRELGYVVEEKP
jgi:hypothetical protein